MSDKPTSFGAEIRLGTGQMADIVPGGTIQVRKEHPQLHHFCMQLANTKYDSGEPITHVRSATYQALLDFLQQAEHLDYHLISIERVDGIVPKIQFK